LSDYDFVILRGNIIKFNFLSVQWNRPQIQKRSHLKKKKNFLPNQMILKTFRNVNLHQSVLILGIICSKSQQNFLYPLNCFHNKILAIFTIPLTFWCVKIVKI